MKYFKRKKLYILILFGLFVLVGGLVLSGCQKADNQSKDEENMLADTSENKNELPAKESGESEGTQKPEEEIKILKGTVKEGMMNTIIILGEDNQVYQFERDDSKIKTGESGILIGNPITVEYKGDLDPNTDAQEVELVSITVEDQK
jgi:hypothetical protein